ncbi:uncharacterized protein BDZ99DRAFT_561033 [Mytilinidion resinicola]|uniref:SET domain-containing protein n=1 Tax=Mytilinidion resinicola TaxID=574789 RepID=A0A6A6YQA0_9PEZI|nr:uncharacterized protein BDZ99DRAFT_561033 [Mytilinidion resinicola]KAF2810703.1 hypothetical protein BDZ99DRAFT_561033 [Mytilinidion resinicola]
MPTCLGQFLRHTYSAAATTPTTTQSPNRKELGYAMDENDLNSPQMRNVISIVAQIRRAKTYYAAGLPTSFPQGCGKKCEHTLITRRELASFCKIKALPNGQDLHSKWSRNAQNFAPYPGEALRLDFAHVKHSCVPNILPHNDGEGVLTVLVLKDIAAGEEFTKTHAGPLLTLEQRKKELADLDIICSCAACDMTTAFSRKFEIRQHKIQRLATAMGTAAKLRIGEYAPSLAEISKDPMVSNLQMHRAMDRLAQLLLERDFPQVDFKFVWLASTALWDQLTLILGKAGRRPTREAWVQRYKWEMELARMDMFVYPPGHKQYEDGKRFMAMYDMQVAKDVASRKA